MSDLGELLELLHTAHARARTVRTVIAKWSDMDLWRLSAQRWREMSEPGRVGIVTFESTLGGRPAPRIEETTYRVWRDKGESAWRIEADGPSAGSVTIVHGEKWWMSVSDEEKRTGWSHFAYRAPGFITNVLPDGSVDTRIGGSLPDRLIELMLDPASLLSYMVFEPPSRNDWAGRATVEAVGRWRKETAPIILDYWPYADEVRLSVDAEYGVILYIEFFLDGKPFIRLQVDEIAFDEVLPASLFEGPPPTPGQSRLPESLFAPRGRAQEPDTL